jgi:xanthine dehydrogenase accessory factor
VSRWLSQLEALRRAGRPFALVTVTSAQGSTPREVGAKMLVPECGPFQGTIGGGQLERQVLEDARSCLANGVARSFHYPLGPKTGQCCGGVMEILVEPLGTEPRLYLFGAGHVGQALCHVLDDTPFTVELVDEREEWVNAPSLPSSVLRHAGPWEDFVARAPFHERRTYVAVMTHQHDLDLEIVADLLRRPAAYLGLIGSEAKWDRFRMRLTSRGYAEAELARVRCPVGLPLGGKSPKEVAVSIAAELLQRHHERQNETGL